MTVEEAFSSARMLVAAVLLLDGKEVKCFSKACTKPIRAFDKYFLIVSTMLIPQITLLRFVFVIDVYICFDEGLT